MLAEHGAMARGYPDVRANTVASFALGDYEWMLAFEADELHRIVDLMRAAAGLQGPPARTRGGAVLHRTAPHGRRDRQRPAVTLPRHFAPAASRSGGGAVFGSAGRRGQAHGGQRGEAQLAVEGRTLLGGSQVDGADAPLAVPPQQLLRAGPGVTTAALTGVGADVEKVTAQTARVRPVSPAAPRSSRPRRPPARRGGPDCRRRTRPSWARPRRAVDAASPRWRSATGRVGEPCHRPWQSASAPAAVRAPGRPRRSPRGVRRRWSQRGRRRRVAAMARRGRGASAGGGCRPRRTPGPCR